MTFFVLFFPAFGYLGTPKHYKTRENAKCQIDPVYPPTGFLLLSSGTKKGGFSKGGFCSPQCHTPGNRTYGYWAQQDIWYSDHHSQERRAFLQKPRSKSPHFFVPDIIDLSIPTHDIKRSKKRARSIFWIDRSFFVQILALLWVIFFRKNGSFLSSFLRRFFDPLFKK